MNISSLLLSIEDAGKATKEATESFRLLAPTLEALDRIMIIVPKSVEREIAKAYVSADPPLMEQVRQALVRGIDEAEELRRS